MEQWGQEHLWLTLLSFTLFATVITTVAFRFRYFNLLARPSSTLSFRLVAGAFGIYLLVALLLQPFLSKLSHLISTGWVQLLYIAATTLGLLLYLWSCRTARRIIFEQPTPLKSLILGIFSWIIYVPWVFVVNLSTETFIRFIWGGSEQEQAAVRQLKSTLGHPWLHGFTIFAIVILVPFCEELLFRGFLQSWLRRFLSRFGAIFCTAFIFAIAHYSPTQGMSNLSLISSLFVLSCGLSFLYERERTLWASFGLHATFNAMTALFLTL